MRILEWICRLVAGGIFIYAAVSKILVPCELAMDMYLYQVAPGSLINLGAIILPYVELILGACLILGIAPRGAALGITLILVFFIVILGINLFRGVDFDCGCFGSVDNDVCVLFSQNYKSTHPDLDRIGFVRIRTGCDIARDLIFITFPGLALLLINRRLKEKTRYIS